MADLVEELILDLELDRDEVLRLLRLYLRACWEDFQAAAGALDSSQGGMLAERAHNIKGASANLRIEDARSAAEALEAAGKTGDLSRAPARLAELRAALNRVKTEVDAG